MSPDDHHFVYDMGIARALDRGCNSYSSDDALWHELGYELGERVHMALAWEDMGLGALFDLSYAFYHALTDPCICGRVGNLATGHNWRLHATGHNWRSFCTAHGIESPWYQLYGKRRFEIRDAQARRMQARARAARQQARG